MSKVVISYKASS